MKKKCIINVIIFKEMIYVEKNEIFIHGLTVFRSVGLVLKLW